MSATAAVEPGTCQCGCGQPTEIAKATSTRRGWVRGTPKRFIHGHGRRGKKLEKRPAEPEGQAEPEAKAKPRVTRIPCPECGAEVLAVTVARDVNYRRVHEPALLDVAEVLPVHPCDACRGSGVHRGGPERVWPQQLGDRRAWTPPDPRGPCLACDGAGRLGEGQPYGGVELDERGRAKPWRRGIPRAVGSALHHRHEHQP